MEKKVIEPTKPTVKIDRMDITLLNMQVHEKYKKLHITIKVNGVEHHIKRMITDNEMISYFDRIWEVIGYEFKKQITKYTEEN